MSPSCSFTFFFSRISLQHYYRVQIEAVSTASQKLPSHLAQPDPPAKKANKKNDLKGRFLKFKGLTTSKVPGDIGILPTSDRWNFLIGTGTSIVGNRWGRFHSICLWGFLVNDLQKGVPWLDVSCTIVPPWHNGIMTPHSQRRQFVPDDFGPSSWNVTSVTCITYHDHSVPNTVVRNPAPVDR